MAVRPGRSAQGAVRASLQRQVFALDPTEFHHDCAPDRSAAHRLADDRRPLPGGDGALRRSPASPTRPTASSPSASTRARSSAPISIRSPTRRCSSPSSCTLGFKGALPAWLIVLVVSRDLFIIGGMLLAYVLGSPMAVKPLWVSKVNTVAQIVLIAFVLADQLRRAASFAAADRRDDRRRRGADRRFGRRPISSDWVRHMAGGPGHVSGAASVNLRAQAAVLARGARCSCSSSSGCSATSCCRSFSGWRSPICSIRSPTGWSGPA